MEYEHKDNLKRVYRQLDFRIIPCLWVLYFLGSAARSNVGLALTMNSAAGDSLQSSINASSGGLTAKQVSLGVALFYVGYVICEIPSNLIMTKCSPHGWISRMILTIGIVEACHAALDSVWSFYLLRTLLGVVEAGLWPAMTYYLTLFYPPTRMATRIGWYFTAAQISAAVVGLVSAGFQEMNGLGGLKGWQWMFLVYGLVTSIDGLFTLFWLPRGPYTDEKGPLWRRIVFLQIPQKPILKGNAYQLHQEDLHEHGAAMEHETWGIKDFLLVLIDVRLWAIILMYFGVVGVGVGLQNYGSIIISAINPSFTSIQLSLLFAPIWIVCVHLYSQ